MKETKGQKTQMQALTGVDEHEVLQLDDVADGGEDGVVARTLEHPPPAEAAVAAVAIRQRIVLDGIRTRDKLK